LVGVVTSSLQANPIEAGKDKPQKPAKKGEIPSSPYAAKLNDPTDDRRENSY
jgi:hypothetical protein